VRLTKYQAVRNQIAEAQKIAAGNGSDQDIAEAKIELEVSAAAPAIHAAREHLRARESYG
jgi:hypothetical protein